MSPASYLIDTSAIARLLLSQGNWTAWEQAASSGLIAVCPLTELELLYSARSGADHERLRRLARAVFLGCPIPDKAYERATVVQKQLARRGEHRGPGPVDLLVAATAEVLGLNLLHHDRDFQTIAHVTGQDTTWYDA